MGAAPCLAAPAGALTRVLVRSAPGDVTVRVYRGGPVLCGAAVPEAPTCPQALRIELSDAAAVGEALWYPGSPPADPSAAPWTSGSFGLAEGDPVWWVVAVVPSPVQRATVAFDGGATDSSPVTAGVVALAAPVAPSSGTVPAGTLTLLDGAGHVLAALPLEHQAPVPGPGPQPVPARSLSPPPLAPGPGTPEQPAPPPGTVPPTSARSQSGAAQSGSAQPVPQVACPAMTGEAGAGVVVPGVGAATGP